MRALRSWPLLLGSLLLACLPGPAAAQPVGEEFQINTYTTAGQVSPSVAADAGGNFVVVWGRQGQGDSYGIFGQRYDGAGGAQGDEFRVNSYTTGTQGGPSVAADASGNFVVVWGSYGQDGSRSGIFGQRYDSGGVAQGDEFRVNSFTTGQQHSSSVAADASGNFVVVWQSEDQDGSDYGIFGQRYDNEGMAQGDEFRVNSVTTNYQRFPSVASDVSGNFVVVWVSTFSGYNNSHLIFGQRYDNGGMAQGDEFRVNIHDAAPPFSFPSVASDASGPSSSSGRVVTRTGTRKGSSGNATTTLAGGSGVSSASTRTRRRTRSIPPLRRTRAGTSSSPG